MPQEIDDEIARLKLATMGVDDRHAHRGAGEVPGLLGRRHLSIPAAEHGSSRLEDGAVVLLDQRRLPDEEVELRCALGGGGRRGDPDARGARRAGDRVAAAYGLRARSRARGGPRRRRERGARGVAADGGQPRLGARAARATIRRPSERVRSTTPRSSAAGGWRARGGAVRARDARAHALQRRRPRDGRLRLGGRRAQAPGSAACSTHVLGRRDAAAAPGRAADGVGARGARRPAHA